MAEQEDAHDLPEGIPAPTDDGVADHLPFELLSVVVFVLDLFKKQVSGLGKNLMPGANLLFLAALVAEEVLELAGQLVAGREVRGFLAGLRVEPLFEHSHVRGEV
jgi:hypothetical protein